VGAGRSRRVRVPGHVAETPQAPGYRKEHIEDCWDEAAKACKVALTWYQASRHSFVTRNFEAGASLDEVSEAVGHSSPVVTKRFYDHHMRRSFSDILTARLPTK
jgi:integrase